jgi:hypothetical protein
VASFLKGGSEATLSVLKVSSPSARRSIWQRTQQAAAADGAAEAGETRMLTSSNIAHGSRNHGKALAVVT